ncbi:MAG: ABC transporter permease [Lachnospiraceae bacterium]|nr:ABC transporter permease [Lachnospiraceae bacterium]
MANQTNTAKKKSIIAGAGGQKLVVTLVIIALILFFSIGSKNFRKYTTFVSILDYSYYIVLLAVGVTFPLITGGVDLSIGTGMMCYALVGGYLVSFKGFPVWFGMLVTVLFGIGIGIVNGLVIALMDIPPFLTTLCTCMITRGLGAILVGGYGITWPTAIQPGGWFRSIFKLSTENNTKIPIGFLWVLLIVLLMSFVLNHTKVGRYTISIGSNKEAARLSGVNVKFYHVTAYAISGLFAGLAAISYAAVFSTLQPGTGAGFELEAIGGAIIGGVSTTGGAGTITGAMLGVFVICLMKTGLPFIGLTANWQQIITGLIVLGAVLLDVLKKKNGLD